MNRLFHRLSIATAALGLGLLGTTSARAGILFTDFGPGDTYNTMGGYSIGGASGAFGQLDIAGATFTADLTGTLTEIDVPFFNQGWPGIFNLALSADDGAGKVGALLESFQNIGPATPAEDIFSVYSSLHPLLTAGDAYWLIATPAGPSTAVYWNENSIGSYGTIYTDSGGSVNYSSDSLLPAFRVIGATSVPEPSALLLGLGGLAFVAALSSRRMGLKRGCNESIECVRHRAMRASGRSPRGRRVGRDGGLNMSDRGRACYEGVSVIIRLPAGARS